jgi:hypothetical protein
MGISAIESENWHSISLGGLGSLLGGLGGLGDLTPETEFP